MVLTQQTESASTDAVNDTPSFFVSTLRLKRDLQVLICLALMLETSKPFPQSGYNSTLYHSGYHYLPPGGIPQPVLFWLDLVRSFI